MINDKKFYQLVKKFHTFCISILLILFFTGCTTSEDWSLFIYSTQNPDTNHLIKRVNSIKDKDSCINAGVSLVNTGSFECGLNCEQKGNLSGTEICDKTCAQNGCRN